MRKHNQKQLLELVKTLHEAHTEIKRLLSNEDTQAVIELLSDCQESAVQIGEFIELLEGEGTKTVSLLEEYCEMLYQMGAAINDTGSDTGILKQLQKQLYIIENSIKTELMPDRIEMLFIPYKASMWDSMESVWLAAKDDPQCEAIVMPIPYYNLRPDGTSGDMYYEGGQYPDYVPIADWQKYNIKERHPDVIVTCNPYDAGNLVTRIYPDFYNQRLKDFTDLLVYIPYFVSVDDVEEIFCICAGTLYADKVIVQSEKVRETYLREFHRFEKENNLKGKFGKAEAKFVALGSPKFDKVINTKLEDCQIPDEWKRLIEKPDGFRRKVILYNTSIFGALNDDEKVLQKLRYVFDHFRSRDDVVLLWRPHPLSTSTYESMRPQYLQEYLNIVGEYKRQGFGIYDDSADMNRAIAISDAYYGDLSSLVILYQCTGKPVMIQNSDIDQTSDQPKYLAFENLYDDGENYWFTSYNFNALFKMERQTWKTEYVGSFPGEPIDGKRLYGQIAACAGKLYFAPASAKAIAEYDPACNTFRQFKVDENGNKAEPGQFYIPQFSEVVLYKDWLFFVGCTYPAIIRLDTITGVIDSFSDWLPSFDKLAPERDGYYFKSVCVVGSRIVAAALNINAIVIYNMESCTSEVYEVGGKEYRYNSICFDGEDYWLSPRFDGPVVRWNPGKTYKEYGSFPDGFVSGRPGFWNILYSCGYVWLFPNQANMALKINIQDGSIIVAEEFPSESHMGGSASSYICSKVIDGVIFAFTGKSKKLIENDCSAQRRREEHILISEEDVPVLVRTNIFNKDSAACITTWNCMFYESRLLSLDDYLAGIVHFGAQAQAGALSARQIEICRRTIRNADGTSGKSIYAHCRQALLHDTGGKR